MKNKILLFGLIIVIMALIIVFGYTNARYYSTASMTGDLDYVKTIGKISVYHPEWVGGYEDPDNGNVTFDVPLVNTLYNNIHYRVINKVDEEINEDDVNYYIRIVAEDESDDIPIEYDVHEYNNENNVLSEEKGVGYGPFKLSVNLEEEQFYSIKAKWISTDIKYMEDIQHLKVQMIKKRIDGTLKVIDETPLNMVYTGEKGKPKINVNIEYYRYGTTPAESLGNTMIKLEPGITINFTNSEQLNELGIKIPTEYSFYHATSVLTSGAGMSEVTIPADYAQDVTIEVYCKAESIILVEFKYYEITNQGTDKILIENTTQTLDIPMGEEIVFNDTESLLKFGIVLPQGYEFYIATSYQLDPTLVGHESFIIPTNTEYTKIAIEVNLKKTENAKTVTALIYNANSEEYLGEMEVQSDDTGTFTFTQESLRLLNPDMLGEKTSMNEGYL